MVELEGLNDYNNAGALLGLDGADHEECEDRKMIRSGLPSIVNYCLLRKRNSKPWLPRQSSGPAKIH